ncbi:PQQ-binding-like beta-propeller repeat protein [Halosimplex rubrum]|uniref:PQQ-binding-like beta-propeller repeat protein n=1 Tax=Halosimplex rubrum TaxID=869889 RepID=A0A7D5P3Y0_9EURY|nr:PQQ-binding-like beta-propeller repeat protein [Halosimplex rubrum]QLH76922.1 PQQ-binding-like beta-propeller repeat protein [Halosimplex rubrum]
MSVRTASGGILTDDKVTQPGLTVTVSGNGATISRAVTSNTDYPTVARPSETTAEFSSETFFRQQTKHSAIVWVNVPDDTTASSIDVTATATDGGTTDDTTTGSYTISESGTSWAALARGAERRATLASGYQDTYHTVVDHEPWNQTVGTAMQDAFSTVAAEQTKSLAMSAVPYAGTLDNAKTAYEMASGDYRGGAVGKTGRVALKLEENLFSRVDTDYVKRGGNASKPLSHLERLYRKEAKAWRNHNREKALEYIQKEYAIIRGTCQRIGPYKYYPSLSYDACLANEALDQKQRAGGTDVQSYFSALYQWSLSEERHITEDLRPLAKDPDPHVTTERDLSAVRTDLAALDVGQQLDVAFVVSNGDNSGLTGRQGYLSFSHADSLTVTNVANTSGDTEAAGVTKTAPGETLFTSTGDTMTAKYPLVDIYESYEPGEQNVYTVTIEKTDADENPWLAYRAAFKPAISEDAQDVFARYPTDSAYPTDQQGWSAVNLTTGSVSVNTPPVPSLSTSNTQVRPSETITIDVSNSSDDSAIASTSIEIDTDDDGNYEQSYTKQTFQTSFDDSGVKRVRVTVTDDAGLSATTTTNITVIERPPLTASFRLNRSYVTTGNATKFIATTAADTYEWDLDADGTIEKTGQQVVHTFESDGNYDVTLTVSNVSGRSASTTATVAVEALQTRVEQPEPVIEAPQAVPPGTSVTFDAGNSTDQRVQSDGTVVDGSITRYEWDFGGDGTVDATGETTTRTFETAGSYIINLTVADSDGNTAAAERTLNVSVDNRPPVTETGIDRTVNEGTSVELDGSGSSDPDGDSLTYQWTQTSGTAVSLADVSTATPTFAAPTVDSTTTLTFELVASDGRATDRDVVNITVSPNAPPEADAGPYRTVDERTSVELDGTGSFDPDRDGLSYEWTQTFGPNVTLSDPSTATPSFTAPDVDGWTQLRFELTVSDGMATNTDGTVVNVEETDPTPTISSKDLWIGSTAQFNASKSVDPDGTIASYEWDFGNDGTIDATGVTTSRQFTTEGERKLSLTVTDADGNTETVVRTFDVNRVIDSQTYDYTVNEEFKDVRRTSDGYVFVGRTDRPTGRLSDAWLLVLDQSGNEILNETYGTAGYSDIPFSVATPKNGYAFLGYHGNVTRVKDDGTEQWTVRTEMENNEQIRATVDGGFVAVGSHVVKLDENGEVEWSALETVDTTEDVIQLPDGDLAVTGRYESYDENQTYLARITPNGTVRWLERYGGSAYTRGTAITRASDGGFAIAGVSETSNMVTQYRVFKTDVKGNLAWSRSHGGSEYEFTTDIVRAVGGGYVVAGESQSVGSGLRSGLLVKYRRDGTKQWNTTIDGGDLPAITALTHTRNGNYTVVGARDNAWVVTVLDDATDQNRPPQLRYSDWREMVSPESAITFDVSPSFDSDGTVASVEWDFGDGTTKTGMTVSHTYDTTGEYTVTITVTDDDGAVTETTRTVTVSRDGDTPPVADAGPDRFVDERMMVTLDGSESYDPNKDDILEYQWTQVSGSSVTLSDFATASPTFVAPNVDARQTLTFELAVSDGKTTTTDRVNITVKPEINRPVWRSYGAGTRNVGWRPRAGGVQGPVEPAWTRATDGAIHLSSPVIWNETVYVGSRDGTVYAFDADSGATEWRFETGSFVDSTPAIANGTVYLGSGDHSVYALDAATGDKQWTYETESFVDSPATITDGTVYIGSDDGTVYALDAETGNEQWTYKTGNWVNTAPAVTAGTVYVGSHDGTIYALDEETGGLQWQYDTGSAVASSPAVLNRTVYVGNNDGILTALDAGSGDPLWTYETDSAIAASPAVTEEFVYVGSEDNAIYAVDANTGDNEWSFATGDDVTSSPAVVNDTVYIGSHDSEVYAIDADRGTEQWSYTTGGAVWSSPAVIDGVVYIGSTDRRMYAIHEQ